MGVWGTKLYQNDVACDVRDIYKDMLSVGIDEEEIINELVDYFREPDDTLILWQALADTQWKYGRLQDRVKDNALKCIDTEFEQLKDNDSYAKHRKKELLLLKEKLNTPQPEKKKIRKRTFWKSPFKKGDLLLFQIRESEYENEFVKKHKYVNKYVLFRVMALGKSSVGFLPRDKYYHDAVILGLYNWVGEENGPSDVSRLNLYESEQKHFNRDILKVQVYLDNRYCVLIGETKKELERLILLRSDNEYVNDNILNEKNMPLFELKELKQEDITFYYLLRCKFYNGNVIDCSLLRTLDKMEESGMLNIEITEGEK